MTEASKKSQEPTLPGLGKLISSLASAAGLSPLLSPDGQPTAKSGPEVVPASHSRQRANGADTPTSAISGLFSENSSASASLQRSLESRLLERMGKHGSPEYALTWKRWDMPSGPPICALRASVPRTSGRGSIGWPTPDRESATRGGTTRQDKKRPSGAYRQKSLNDAALLAGWPTPRTTDSHGSKPHGNGGQGLHTVAAMHGWQTPTAHNPDGYASPRFTPTLAQQAGAFGATSNTPTAKMERIGVLNPELPRWLMGFPAEWGSFADTATRLSRKSQRSL